MKRGRDLSNVCAVETIDMANLLIILSQNGPITNSNTNLLQYHNPSHDDQGRVFECKTCLKQFTSFQALGGHRASHKKPKLVMGSIETTDSRSGPFLANKRKVHECSVCGLEFSVGQALGGHMRRHRLVGNEGFRVKDAAKSELLFDLNSPPMTSTEELVTLTFL